jgi:hypothetical protein
MIRKRLPQQSLDLEPWAAPLTAAGRGQLEAEIGKLSSSSTARHMAFAD